MLAATVDEAFEELRATVAHGRRRLMRVYIPATWPMLRKLVANDRLDPWAARRSR